MIESVFGKDIRRRYILALAFIAFVVTLTGLWVGKILTEQYDDAYVVNLSGMQRMLSQKIALQVHILESFSESEEQTQKTLRSAITRFELNHKALTDGAMSDKEAVHLSSELRDLIFVGDPSLHERVQEYIRVARDVAEGNRAATQAQVFSPQHIETLLMDLDAVVSQFEAETSSSVEMLQFVGSAAWSLIMLVLVMEAFLIFKPMEEGILRRTDELERERKNAILLKEAAERATIAKTEFLANMSHELRTPLNGTLGMLELAESELNDEKRKEFIVKAHQSGKHLLSIVNDILDIAKIESGKTELEEHDFELPVVLDSCLSPFAITCERKNLKFRFVANTDLPVWVRADSTRLSQIINNLLNNAVKFTSTGSITVTAGVKVDNGLMLELVVQDTGIGISPEKLDDIFERFNQADNSRTREYGGTGIGLSICKELTELLGGNIWVESEEDAGSTFYVQIPLGQPDNKVVLHSPVSTDETVRCAVIDDLDTSCRYMQLILRQINMETDIFLSGEEFLRQEKDISSYFAVFIDLHMPGMDGIEVARALQARLGNKCPKLIMVSAASDELDSLPHFSNLFWKLYTKPINPYAITRDMKVALGHVEPESGEKRALRVLVVEDNEINAQIVKHMLEGNGHSVKHVCNGEEAVQAVQEDCFDLVLMDVDMPVMDGLQASKIIKTKLKLSVPIIALTAHAYESDKRASQEAGMTFHVSKPIDKNILMETIDKAMSA